MICSARLARRPFVLALASAASLVTVVAQDARAAVAGNYLGGGTATTFFNATGYFFTPTTNLTVSSLGYYDEGAPGLASAHDVGIFVASSATAVATATVPAGVAATYVANTVGGSRYVTITPVTLLAGTQYYTVANNNTSDQFVFGNGSVVYAPQVTWNGFGDATTNSISSGVSNNGGVPGNLGPNFIFNVPEPTALAALAGAGIALRRRRRA